MPELGRRIGGRHAGLRHTAGARTNGLADVTGSLVPGKQADLLMITAEEINNMPLNDPIGTVVLGADARNVDTVLIAGQVCKWNGRLLAVDLPALRAEVATSRDYILAASTTLGSPRPATSATERDSTSTSSSTARANNSPANRPRRQLLSPESTRAPSVEERREHQ